MLERHMQLEVRLLCSLPQKEFGLHIFSVSLVPPSTQCCPQIVLKRNNFGTSEAKKDEILYKSSLILNFKCMYTHNHTIALGLTGRLIGRNSGSCERPLCIS